MAGARVHGSINATGNKMRMREQPAAAVDRRAAAPDIDVHPFAILHPH